MARSRAIKGDDLDVTVTRHRCSGGNAQVMEHEERIEDDVEQPRARSKPVDPTSNPIVFPKGSNSSRAGDGELMTFVDAKGRKFDVEVMNLPNADSDQRFVFSVVKSGERIPVAQLFIPHGKMLEIASWARKLAMEQA